MIHKKTTAEILGESIHELASIKPVDKISIKEIVTNCGLSSATFYRHFKDKYELMAWMYNYQMEKIFADFCDGTQSFEQAVYDLIEIFDSDKVFFVNVFKNTDGPNSFFWSTHSRSVELLTDYIKHTAHEEINEELLFDIKFYLRGMYLSFADWYLNDHKYSVRTLTDFLYNAMPESLKPFLIQK